MNCWRWTPPSPTQHRTATLPASCGPARERVKGHTMAFHALQMVRAGKTSLAEALRIGFDADDADEAMAG